MIKNEQIKYYNWLWEFEKMIRCGPDEFEKETDMKVADSLTT